MTGTKGRTAPSARRVRSLLKYDPDTGLLTWRVNRGRARRGSAAGYLNKTHRRRLVRLCGRLYYASRLAWVIKTGLWPAGFVDHHDCDSTNDRWTNLRLATRAQNAWNQGIR